jgi:hypothetical protein
MINVHNNRFSPQSQQRRCCSSGPVFDPYNRPNFHGRRRTHVCIPGKAQMKNKRQRKFDKILEDLCLVCGELGLEHMKAKDRGDDSQAEIYAIAQNLINAAIELVDPGVNPRFVVTVQEVKHD